MQEIRYVISDPQGMHARPASMLVKLASAFSSEITIAKEDKRVDAKRIMGVMSLGIKQNQELIIQIQGEDEDLAKNKLENFLKENL